ncbi:hypothetical protein [Blastococcus haudaquaticus]|uniref:DUF2304 domain-containing protein n=1 Tax=Blastococcus haudaquaticus TaxID=1938745 RepID=A0A286GEB2_9ACTN|nr:hypothetical protein [Blastococcus haudaquaticus]SOD93832.1 hypothetical protein SAMN06272739_0449 [Blastococcus haudaquaticus]
MNKYVLLVLINAPLIMFAILMAVTSYKTGRSTRRRCTVLVVFWLLVGIGMLFVEPLYDLLVRKNLTASPPLSVFDILLLSGLIFQMLIMVQLYDKLNNLSRKVSRMHEGIAIMEESKLKVNGSVANV